jgi:hypothetical protein
MNPPLRIYDCVQTVWSGERNLVSYGLKPCKVNMTDLCDSAHEAFATADSPMLIAQGSMLGRGCIHARRALSH